MKIFLKQTNKLLEFFKNNFKNYLPNIANFVLPIFLGIVGITFASTVGTNITTEDITATGTTTLGTSLTGILKGTSGVISAISDGTSGQYLKEDATWADLTKEAIAGLKITDSPTFAGLTLGGATINADGATVEGKIDFTATTDTYAKKSTVTTSSNTQAAHQLLSTYSANSASAKLRNFQSSATYTGSGVGGDWKGITNTNTFTYYNGAASQTSSGTGITGNHIGFYFSGIGTLLSDFTGIKISTENYATTNGTISNISGYSYKGIHITNSLFPTHTNAGIWIDQQTNGATNNYGIVFDGEGKGSGILMGPNQETYMHYDSTNKATTWLAEKIIFVNPVNVPAINSGCGTGASIQAGSGDSAGRITIGTGSPTSCVINFATDYGVGNTPVCVVSSTNSSYVVSGASSRTQLTIGSSAGMTSSDVIHYICMGI